MSLIPRNSIFDLDNFFDHFYSPMSNKTMGSQLFSPKVDIKDKEKHYEIVADLPGVDKEHLTVTLEEGMLTIEASTEDEKTEEEDGRIIRKERHTGKFLRSFTLGAGIQESDITANFKDGVLTLKAPKLKDIPAERKKISIN